VTGTAASKRTSAIRSLGLYAAVALPPLALAIIGTTHPHHLTPASALYWRNLHVLTLPIFPLLGFAPWLIVRFRRNLAISWVAGVLGFVYAAFYTGLDVLAGIGGGGLEHAGMDMATGTVFHLGNGLGFIGSIAFIAACVIAGVVAIRETGVLAVPGALLVIAGSFLFLERHIFFPLGVLGQLCLAVGWIVILIAAVRKSRSGAATVSRTATV
jgi:hypothetical protein